MALERIDNQDLEERLTKCLELYRRRSGNVSCRKGRKRNALRLGAFNPRDAGDSP
jgi:hypothetical protein